MATTGARLYLDHNAGAPLRPEARAAMLAALDAGGNASSVHGEGRAARARIEMARGQVAALVGASPRGVTFTSGGSEANATVLTPEWTRDGRPLRFDRLMVSAVEHPSVLRGGRFAAERVTVIPVDGDGIVDLDGLRRALAEASGQGERVLVSVMLAGNETGAIQPVAAIAALVHEAGGLLHSDATQAAGRIPVDIAALGADVLTLSAHKLGGPQGVGAIVRAGVSMAFRPLVTGGGQEQWARAGTENVAGIAGFGAAAEAARVDLAGAGRIAALRDAIEAGVRAATPSAIVLSEKAERLPNTLCVAVPGLSAETAVIAFDLAGIALSAGSACSSGKVGPSPVAVAMGLDDVARGTLRVSLGRDTAEADVERFLAAWRRIVGVGRKGEMHSGTGTRAA